MSESEYEDAHDESAELREMRQRWGYTRSAAENQAWEANYPQEDDTIADKHIQVTDLAGNEVAKVPLRTDGRVQIGKIRRRVFDWCGHWWFSLVDAETAQAIEGRDHDEDLILDREPGEEFCHEDNFSVTVLIDVIPESIIRKAYSSLFSAKSFSRVADQLPRLIVEAVFENEYYLVRLFARHAKAFGLKDKDNGHNNLPRSFISFHEDKMNIVLKAIALIKRNVWECSSRRRCTQLADILHVVRDTLEDSDFGIVLSRAREVVLAAVSTDGLALRNAPECLRNDKEVVLVAVAQDTYVLKHASYPNHNKIESVRVAVAALQYASESLRNDKEVVLEAVSHHGDALQYASESLRNDKEVVLMAVSHHADALQYASESLRNDKEVVLMAVSHDGRALQHASESLKSDKEVVLHAVAQNGYALELASENLRDDKEVVLEALAQKCAPECASIISDSDVVLEAVSQSRSVLQCVSESLKDDKEVVLNAIAQDGCALEFASEALRDDREIVMTAAAQDGHSLMWASRALRDDRKVVLRAIAQNGYALQHASKSLRNDRRVVLKAVAREAFALKFASKALRDDAEIVSLAIRGDPMALNGASNRLRNCSKEELEDALSQDRIDACRRKACLKTFSKKSGAVENEQHRSSRFFCCFY